MKGGHARAFIVPTREEKGQRGNASCSIVPTTRGKDERWSRKVVHRARLEENKLGAVTQERSSCPAREEKGQRGNASCFNVPS